MSSESTLVKTIRMANSRVSVPAEALVRPSPQTAAALAKLVPNAQPPAYGSDNNRKPPMPDVNGFRTISAKTDQNISDNETVMQLLPDQEMACQILTSCTLAPNDMMAPELTFKGVEDLVPAEINAQLIGEIDQHFDKVHKIKSLLPKMLRDALFVTGSYAVAVIPENSIDEVINRRNKVSLEDLSEHVTSEGLIKPLGALGPVIRKEPTAARKTGHLSLEAFDNTPTIADEKDSIMVFEQDPDINAARTKEGSDFQTYVSVTDNYSVLKMPAVMNRVRDDRMRGLLAQSDAKFDLANSEFEKSMEEMRQYIEQGNYSAEGVHESQRLTDRELTQLVFQNRSYQYSPITALKTQEQLTRNTVGNPLVQHFPSAAVIPAYVPGSPEVQVGYFVLLDGEGYPLNRRSNPDYYREMGTRLQSGASFPSAMLSKANQMMIGQDCSDHQKVDFSIRAYGELVEQDLLARLRNGEHPNGVALASNEEIYRIMLARSLARQQTQLLWVPAQLMTYIAFDYNADGIGRSILDRTRVLNSIRIMMLFAQSMASMKNSIGRTTVTFNLDEDDQDPTKAIETGIHEIIRTRQQYFPLGLNSPVDIVDYLQKAGYEFKWKGNPRLPEFDVEFNETNSNYVKPDTEFTEDLKKLSILASSVPSEIVDSSFEAEFAGVALRNHIMLSKRVVQIQEQFLPQLRDFLRKAAMNSEDLVKSLREIIESNYDRLNKDRMADTLGLPKGKKLPDDVFKRLVVNYVLREYVSNFDVSLPSPNSVTLENQMEAMEVYSQALDKALDAWLSDSFFTSGTSGELSGEINSLRNMLKAHFLRQWMAENGVMTELAQLTAKGEDNKPIMNFYESQVSHMESLNDTLSEFMVNLQASVRATNKNMQKVSDPDAGSTGADETTTSSGSDSGGGSDSFMDDFPSDPASTDETTDPDAELDEDPDATPEESSDTQPASDTGESTEPTL